MSAEYVQLDFFEPITEKTFLKKEMDSLCLSVDKFRRRTFAEINNISKLVVKQQEEIEALQRQLMMVAKAVKP